MASTTLALQKYTQQMDALQAHMELNQPVFSAHQRIVEGLIDAENELRDAVAEAGAGVSNDKYRVTLTPQTQTFVDFDVLDRFIAQGKVITQADRALFVKTQVRPPRITISPIPPSKQ